MPKQHSDVLVDLIRTLSKAEKRHFKLYTGRSAAGTDALFIKLFDILDRLGRYDEEAILKRETAIKRSQLANLRAKLYKELLVALRMLHSTSSAEIAIREQLDFAQILYKKGLYRQSLNVLGKARARALEMRMHPLALEISAFEKQIESQHITYSIDSTAEELSEDSAELVEIIAGETHFSNLSLQLYGLYLKMGHARNETEVRHVKDFFMSQLPQYDELSLSFHGRLYLYQSYVWLYQLTQEFAKQYRYARKWVDLFHEEDSSKLIENYAPLYIKGLHNLLNNLYLSLRYDKFIAVLDELKNFNREGNYRLSRNDQALQKMFTYNHLFNKHFLEGTFSEALVWLPDLVALLKENPYNWDNHRVMIFYYKIACTYFSAGYNEEAITYLNKIINDMDSDIREDIQSFARILNLIAHFELGNDILVSYQLKSVYRYLLKMEELNATHGEILRFLRRTTGIGPSQLKEEFTILLNKLHVTQQQQFERRSNLYLDIISWLESKIQGRPVQDVIRDKFLLMEASRN